MKPFQWIQGKQKWAYMALISTISAIVIFISIPFKAQFQYDYRLGQVWLEDDFYAPTDFVLPKSADEIAQDRATLSDHKDLYFDYRYQVDYWTKDLSKVVDSTARPFADWQRHGVISTLPKDQNGTFLSDGSPLNLNQAFTPESIKATYGLPDSVQIKPTYVLNEAKTDSALSAKLAQLTTNKGIVAKGTPIILRGATVTAEKFDVLKALEQNFDGENESISLQNRVGGALYIIIVLIALATYLHRYDSHILEHSSSLNLYMFTFTGAATSTLIISSFTALSPYAVPILLLPVIIRSFFNDRLALITTVFLLFLLSPFISGAVQFTAVQFAAALITLYNIRGIYKRSQLVQSTLRIMFALLLVHLSIHLIRQAEWNIFAAAPLVASIGGTLLLLFIFPIIYFFERIFGVVSDLTLLELSDTNSPLLKRLSKEAPGTFQHTMQVANLAEHATELVGGNTLLVRTGALYHDIGKMSAPQYFTENQSSSASPHDELSYTESAEIIVGHVAAGIELAKKEHLPDIVIDFIRTHHGTSRVEYFYRKFKEDHPDADQFQIFHYPGPKPFSKETAIVMMSDAVEASTRSLPEKSQINLSTMIDRVIDHQLTTGQLDNADITLKEINTIREAFKKFMRGVYHVRIEYPEEQ